MAPTRIKICGITRAEDAAAAAAAGTDAIGLVFYPPSARAIDIETAQAIVAELPPFVTAVALFLDADSAAVDTVLESVAVDLLQFHGREDADFCCRFGRPYIKAIGMAGEADVAAVGRSHPNARGLLVDSHRPGEAGGTGEAFGWDRLPGEERQRLILAGGLNPDTVRAAVSDVRPGAVDVSTGVERIPGQKDAERMQRFIEEVRRGDGNASI